MLVNALRGISMRSNIAKEIRSKICQLDEKLLNFYDLHAYRFVCVIRFLYKIKTF